MRDDEYHALVARAASGDPDAMVEDPPKPAITPESVGVEEVDMQEEKSEVQPEQNADDTMGKESLDSSP